MNLLWFLLLIVVLVTVHELGHLVAAWVFGVQVERVGIGLGPVIARLKFRGTEYAIACLPIGGYVRLLGEDGVDPQDGDGSSNAAQLARAFHRRPLWQRLLIIVGGPAANIGFAIVVFLMLASDVKSAPSSEVGWAQPGQPAAEADLRAGDRVIAIDGTPIRFWSEIQALIADAPGREIRVTVDRPGEARPLTKYVTPRSRERVGIFGGHEHVGVLGISPERRLPRVGVLANSASWRAGLRSFDQIASVQGRAVRTVKDLDLLIKPRNGSMVVVTVLRNPGTEQQLIGRMQPLTLQLIPDAIIVDGHTHYELGLRPAELFVYAVDDGGPAARAGLQRGDQLLALDGTPLDSWEQLTRVFEEKPHELHRLKVRPSTAATADGEREVLVQVERQRALDEYQAESSQWTLGLVPGRASEPVAEEPLEPRVVAALHVGLGQASQASSILFRAMLATMTGGLAPSSLGGPIFVYEVTGVAASHGADQFFRMAAVLSINLGLLNLLPVPMLDGGQAAVSIFESLRRRRIRPATHQRIAYIGLVLLGLLVAFASINDLMRRFWR